MKNYERIGYGLIIAATIIVVIIFLYLMATNSLPEWMMTDGIRIQTLNGKINTLLTAVPR